MDEQEWLAGYQSPPMGFESDQGEIECPQCHGVGEYDDTSQCGVCRGSGFIKGMEFDQCSICGAKEGVPCVRVPQDPDNWAGSHDRTPIYDTIHVDPVPVSVPEPDLEAERLAENERFKVWEDGFLAGLHSVNGEHRKNPYHWHGLGFVPNEADLGDIRVRVFLGTHEIPVSAIGSIERDRRGTQIHQVMIHPEAGSR
jgi:hypothetical protein